MIAAIVVGATLLGAPAATAPTHEHARPILVQFFTEPRVGKPLYEPYRRGVRPGLSRGSPRDPAYSTPRDIPRSMRSSRPSRIGR